MSERAFFAVFGYAPLRRYIFSFQSGVAFQDFNDVKKIALIGHLTLFRLKGFDLHPEGLPAALGDLVCCSGNLDFVRCLHALETKEVPLFTTSAINWAAKYGHLEVVQWLHTHRHEGCSTWAMDWAARYGYLEVVQWLHVHRREGCTTDAMNWAAANQWSFGGGSVASCSPS